MHKATRGRGTSLLTSRKELGFFTVTPSEAFMEGVARL